MWLDLSPAEVTVESGFKLFQKAFKLVQMQVESSHVSYEKVAKAILVHQCHKETKCLFLGHLPKLVTDGEYQADGNLR